jgi:hypothetical protein
MDGHLHHREIYQECTIPAANSDEVGWNRGGVAKAIWSQELRAGEGRRGETRSIWLGVEPDRARLVYSNPLGFALVGGLRGKWVIT